MTQAPTSEQLTVQGVSLALRKQGSGPPLLYLHDELTSAWHPFLESLSQRFTVFARNAAIDRRQPLPLSFDLAQDERKAEAHS
ncbi:MAG: hypothetical protein V3S98_10460 [Dehalococcoidia bacterium]